MNFCCFTIHLSRKDQERNERVAEKDCSTPNTIQSLKWNLKKWESKSALLRRPLSMKKKKENPKQTIIFTVWIFLIKCKTHVEKKFTMQ